MFVIMVYDVNVKRINKVLKKSREYLNWVQNSVLEGDLSPAKFEKLKVSISKIVKQKEDSVIFYILRYTKYSERQIIGKKKGGGEVII